MEDDVGASLATPDSWAHSLLDLIDFLPERNCLDTAGSDQRRCTT